MEDLTRRGCLKRFLIFIAVLVSIIIVLFILTYKQFNGKEGVKRWIVSKAIDNTQKLVLEQKPDGITEEKIKQTFAQVKSASKNDQIQLIKLYQILEKYQRNFKNKLPSNEEMAEFIAELRTTIIEEKE